MTVTFDDYITAHPRMGTATSGPLCNGYPVSQPDVASIVTVTPGTLVYAVTAFSGALPGRYVGTGVNAYGDRCLRVQLTAPRPGYARGEVIDVKPDDAFLRSSRHTINHKYCFYPRPLYFT